jgi:glycosyltransferase involved in cell wall biosynthesis
VDCGHDDHLQPGGGGRGHRFAVGRDQGIPVARILFVNTRYRPPYFRGGVERYIHVVGQAFQARGHQTEIVAFEEPLACESDVPHHFLSAARVPFLRPLMFSWMGRRLWRGADLIVLQYMPLGLLMPLHKVVCTVHTTGYGEATALRQASVSGVSGWWKRARRHLSLPLERRVLQRSAKIIAISEQIASELTAAYGIAREKIAVVGNGVNCAEFRPNDEPKGRTPLRVLYVGRLAPRKNVDLLVRAAALCKSQPQIRVVGTGPEQARVQMLAQSLGLSSRASFPGFRKGADLLAEYQWADVLVMPSAYEGVPLVALEAKAAGLPMIAADFPGASAIVSPASGRIVPNISADSLAAAIDEFGADPQQLNRMSASTRREALDSFSWQAVVDRLASEYEGILRNNS